MKKECEIVKDLLPIYVEGKNQITTTTKDFIENHIKNCKECNDMLQFLLQQQEGNSIEDSQEFDFLKKCNQKIRIFKTIAIILSIFIICTWSFISIKQIGIYIKGKRVQEIINKSIEGIEDFKKNENFEFSINDTDMIYYKDNQFKENIVLPENELGCTLKFGKEIDGNVVVVNFWDYVQIITGSITDKMDVKSYIFDFQQSYRYLYNLKEKNINELR